MKILVLSDSHSALRFMYDAIDAVKPNCVIHLGDYFDDGAALTEKYPGLTVYQVPGNCDYLRCPAGQPEIKVLNLDGVTLYLTHGHRHQVKSGLEKLISAARLSGAHAVLFGHTHSALCRKEADGMVVMNPGASGFGGGSAGILEIAQKRVTACRIIGQADLADLV